MRIAFLVTSYPALSATFVQNQITGLVESGHDVDIFGDRPGETERMHDDVTRLNLLARTHAPKMPATALLRALKAPLPLARLAWHKPGAIRPALSGSSYGKLARGLVLLYSSTSFLPPRTYDIVHAHFGPNGVRGQFLRDVGLLSGKLLTSWYGYDLTRTLQEGQAHIYRDLFARGDLLLPLCGYFQDKLVDLGCPREKMRVHHIGVDTDRFEFRERTLPVDRPVRIFSIARLVDKKGIAYGIRAIAALRDAGCNVRYAVAGDGPLRAELEALITHLKLDNLVTLHGWQKNEQVAALLRESDILLAPSVTAADGDQEGTPTVIMEASSMGMPVVSTFHSGIPEIIDNGVTGTLVPERDVEGLTAALKAMIEAPEQWAAMGRAGRAKIEREFNTNRLNADLISIYESVLESAGSRSSRPSRPY